ncbi:MAG TPA: group III truncated hemoglobin [Microthrixaceae bacterium]|nr:group III truncated hemoglobin [Microthrixaceae bacterium]
MSATEVNSPGLAPLDPTLPAKGLPGPTLPDLDSRSQIHDLVVHFYREIVFDEFLDHVFEDVAQVDWNTHIPKLIDYWCRVLLGQPGYEGTILAPHQEVHDLESFTQEHFDKWFALWVQSIDERWSGPVASRPM